MDGRLRAEARLRTPPTISWTSTQVPPPAEGRGLKGHSFGNLFLTALTNLTGDFVQAVKVSSEVLASLGRIYPATNSNVVLEAEL